MAESPDSNSIPEQPPAPDIKRTTGMTSNVDLEKLFQEAEQTINRIIHSKKDAKDEPPPEPPPVNEQRFHLYEEELEKSRRRYQELETDFQNYQERMERQIKQLTVHANAVILQDFLEIMDVFNFAMSTFSSEKFNHSPESFMKGFNLLFTKFFSVLDKIGLEKIPTEGMEFDPNIHQAAAAEEFPGVERQVILKEIKAGYKYQGILLRPSLVKVAIPPKGDRPPGTDGGG
jgi:molecular chaperone GrpE